MRPLLVSLSRPYRISGEISCDNWGDVSWISCSMFMNSVFEKMACMLLRVSRGTSSGILTPRRTSLIAEMSLGGGNVGFSYVVLSAEFHGLDGDILVTGARQ